MKKYKEVTKTQTVQELESEVCDICGDNENDWLQDHPEKDSSHVNVSFDGRFEYRLSVCYGYDYGGTSESIELDICPKCFKEKVIPFIKEISVNSERIKIKEYDW